MNIARMRLFVGVAALSGLFSAGAAKAALLGADFNGVLYDVDTSTGSVSNPRATSVNYLSGLARRSDGALFGMTPLFTNVTPNAIYSIDPVTGGAVLIGATGLNAIYEGDLAFDPTSGTLYGIQNVPFMGRGLFTVNTSTGAATLIGDITTSGDLSGLAFDQTGNMYVINSDSNQLLLVDKSTGAVISAVDLTYSLGQVLGFAIDPVTGDAYVADGGNGGLNNLFALNLETGGMDPLGELTGASGGLASLAYVPDARIEQTPEPGTIALAAAGLILVLARRVVFRR